MASREHVGIRTQLALEAICDVLRKYDPDVGERLAKAADSADETAVPSLKQTDLVTAYLSESVASLAKLVDQQLTPRRRGRPKKSA